MVKFFVIQSITDVQLHSASSASKQMDWFGYSADSLFILVMEYGKIINKEGLT